MQFEIGMLLFGLPFLFSHLVFGPCVSVLLEFLHLICLWSYIRVVSGYLVLCFVCSLTRPTICPCDEWNEFFDFQNSFVCCFLYATSCTFFANIVRVYLIWYAGVFLNFIHWSRLHFGRFSSLFFFWLRSCTRCVFGVFGCVIYRKHKHK